jgi:large subunit ribosomal protein L4
MLRLALASALSNRVRCNRVVVLEPWSSQEPSTKKAAALLSSLGASGNLLFVGGSHGEMNRSFYNIANVFAVQGDQLTTFDVLRADWVIFSLDALPGQVDLGEPGEEEGADG